MEAEIENIKKIIEELRKKDVEEEYWEREEILNNEINNGSINMINNDNFRDEINLTKDKEIKRINDYGNKSLDDKDDNIRINNTNDLDFFSNFSNNNIIKKKEKDKTKNDIEDKDSQENKYSWLRILW